MINLIGLGLGEGNISFNALKAIKDSDIIIKDVNFKPSGFIFDYIMVKEVIGDDLVDNASRLELAIAESKKGKDIAFLSEDYSNVHMSNLLIQISSKYKDVDLKIYPAISAIEFASSLLGAPLDDYAVVNLNNPLSSSSEMENKIKHIAQSNLVLAIYNPIIEDVDILAIDTDETLEENISDDEEKFDVLLIDVDESIDIYNRESIYEKKDINEVFHRFKEIITEIRGKNILVAIVNTDSSFKILQLNDLNEDDIQSDSILIVGNKITHLQDGYMVTASDYIVKNDIHPISRDFFKRYLNDETPRGIDEECDFLPCHDDLEACDYCYCPFYPCADASTGGEWIKDKQVWSCMNCSWIHHEDAVKCIRPKLEGILTEVDDLKNKHEELLKIRRECLLNTKLD